MPFPDMHAVRPAHCGGPVSTLIFLGSPPTTIEPGDAAQIIVCPPGVVALGRLMAPDDLHDGMSALRVLQITVGLVDIIAAGQEDEEDDAYVPRDDTDLVPLGTLLMKKPSVYDAEVARWEKERAEALARLTKIAGNAHLEASYAAWEERHPDAGGVPLGATATPEQPVIFQLINPTKKSVKVIFSIEGMLFSDNPLPGSPG